MEAVDQFIAVPTYQRLTEMKKDDIIEVGQRLELETKKSHRKATLVRIVAEHMVDNDIFHQEILDQLPVDAREMSPNQLELEKTRITAQFNAQARIEEARIIQETRLRELELERGTSGSTPSKFDITRHVRLVPHFEETAVDEFFAHFERTAANLGWPKDSWAPLLQTALIGRAQSVFAALSTEDCAVYDKVKAAILRAFQLVPEAYRRRFRELRKEASQSYTEYARQKETRFDRWTDTEDAARDVEKLRQLMLVEDFLSNVPADLRAHLVERKLRTIYELATCADEYVLTRGKNDQARTCIPTGDSPPAENQLPAHTRPAPGYDRPPTERRNADRPGRWQDPRPTTNWHREARRPPQPQPFRPLGCISTGRDEDFRPFISRGLVCARDGSDRQDIGILRDTGSAQTVMLRECVPRAARHYPMSYTRVRGIEGRTQEIPVCLVHIESDVASGLVPVGLVDAIPIRGVSLILGNDLAGHRIRGDTGTARRKGPGKAPNTTQAKPKKPTSKESERVETLLLNMEARLRGMIREEVKDTLTEKSKQNEEGPTARPVIAAISHEPANHQICPVPEKYDSQSEKATTTARRPKYEIPARRSTNSPNLNGQPPSPEAPTDHYTTREAISSPIPNTPPDKARRSLTPVMK